MPTPTATVRRSSLKAIGQQRGYVLNGYINIPSPASAELYALQGWDTVTLDMEHGAIGLDTAVDILRAIAASGAVPLVRIGRGDPSGVSTLLDAGAMGVTGAMIDTPADALRLVQACRFPPQGQRGMSRQSRAAMVYGPDYIPNANRDVSVMAMVETPLAVANLEAIASVPGIDGIYFGGVDFEMAFRAEAAPSADLDASVRSAVASARDQVVRVCRERGLLAGMNASTPDAARQLQKEGFRFITMSSDAAALTSQARAWVGQVRALFDGAG